MTDQAKLKFKPKRDVTVSGRVPGEDGDQLDLWCATRYRKRSEVVGLIVSAAVRIMRESGGVNQAVEDFVRRLHLEPA